MTTITLKVLLWDEPFNNEELAMSGVVGTNDEVTRIYFSNTKVISYFSYHGYHSYHVIVTVVTILETLATISVTIATV